MAMTDSAYMGIDGGGSTLRIAVVDSAMRVLAETQRGTANPSSIGRDAAKALIQDAMREVMKVSPPIAAVGIGIAGAAAAHSADWLREVVGDVLPAALIVPSSDMEIALVGANGERRGVLLLAGTGSVAYGINDTGEALQVGGWGYLLGDEGGGYCIGMEALRTVIREADGTHPYHSSLSNRVLEALQMSEPSAIIGWLYGGDSRVGEIAQLTALVLNEAEHGDLRALEIINMSADDLARLAHTLMHRLSLNQPQIAFAGGLLSSENILSRRLYRRLNLSTFPTALYPPVIGGALLAKGVYDAYRTTEPQDAQPRPDDLAGDVADHQ